MSGNLQDRFENIVTVSESSIFSLCSARDKVTGRDVSIRKFRPPYDAEPAFHEAIRAAISETDSIKHHNLEKLNEVVIGGPEPYVLGDAVKGMPISERIRKLAPFSVPNSVGTAISICETISAIHRANLAHGDIGEHNVRVLLDGAALVQNAGIWKAYSASQTAGAAVLPQMAPYLAPEVSKGGLPTPASDVYAIGILLFQLLTGRYPYLGDQPLATAMLHTTEAVPSARSVNSGIPVALDEVVKKAMAKNREERYPSATEMLSDLRMIQDALRFGRSLTWPIQSGTASPNPSPVPNSPRKVVEKPEPTMPKDRQKVSPMTSDDEEPPRVSDVPGWLKWVVVFLMAVIGIMIGTYLVFNLKQPKLVVVPKLEGLTVAQAKEVLKPLKLNLRTMRRQVSESAPPDTILDSDPIAKTKLKEGSSVGVVVSSGGRFVEVPDLRGMTVDKARLLLNSLGLDINRSVKEERDRNVAKGLIIKQAPAQRKRVERNTEIQVTVSSGRDAPTIDPDDQKPYLYTISIELSNIDEPVVMRVEMTDSRGTRTISEQERQPQELVELSTEGYGSQAIFSIYYNDRLIMQRTQKAKPEDAQ